MNIFVCLKQVPDTETKIAVLGDGSGIDDSSVKWIVNPYDEYAIEEALKTKPLVQAEKVIAVTLGPKSRAQDALRTALAMGADEAVLVDSDELYDTGLVAETLAAALKTEGNIGYIFTGKLSIDDNQSAFSQQLAEKLELPHVTVVSELKIADGQATCSRDSDGGVKETIQVEGPAVLACNKGLNTPRYASLPGIMKAKKKPLKIVTPAELGVEAQPRIRLKNFELPPEKPAVRMIDGDPGAQAKELARLLKDEAKVL